MRRVLRWLLFPLALTFGLPLIVAALTQWRVARIDDGSVLRIRLDGSVSESLRPALPFIIGNDPTQSLHGLVRTIRRAAKDEHIRGLVLDLQAPGLGLAQVHELREAVVAFNASGKPSLAFFETAGEFSSGDGLYTLATAAQEVMMMPTGEINLTGLRSEVPFVKEAFARLHIEPYVEQRYEYKNYVNTFTERGFTAQHREALKSVLDDLQEGLLQQMAAGRGVEQATVRGWVMASPHSSQEALARKLVDKLGYWDEAAAAAERWAGRAEPWVSAARYGAALAARGSQGPLVALIVGSGEIVSGEQADSPWAGDKMAARTVTEAFRQARADGVRAVLFRIDSPGGGYLPSDAIRREVQLTREAKIPIVVSMGNVAASGGYFAAIEADHIVAQPTSITGSIGVLAATFPLRQTVERFAGVTFDSYDALPHPGNLSWLDPPTPADRARLSGAVDRIYKDFVSRVAAARRRSYEEIHRVAKGRIWTGKQAQALGLVDSLGGYSEALAIVRERLELAADAPLTLQAYAGQASPWALLRSLVGGGQAAVSWPAALVPLWRGLRGDSPVSLTLPWSGPQ